MNPTQDNAAVAEVRSLAEAVCRGPITPEQCDRLNVLLLDEMAALNYAIYLRMHGLLCWHWQDQPVVIVTEGPAAAPGAAVHVSLLGGVWQGVAGVFSQTLPLSYLTATVILGLMLLGAWAYKITHDYGPFHAINSSYAKNSRGLTAPGESAQRPEPLFVARVTGMKDCRWADPATETYAGAAVPLGRKYALSSGLMEITYRSGAKVILEGPCRYTVESTAGGYLALGKLTARVEKRSEVRGRRSDAGGLAASAASMQPQAAKPRDPSPKPQALRPKTKISKSPNLQISKSLFAVRTPTALVTDLGTEFGVEVSANGDTVSHVFRGAVKVQVFGGDNPPADVVLKAGESARVEKSATRHIAVVRGASNTTTFVRQMPQLERIKVFNTGVGLRVGEEDPHWQLAAYSQEPELKPRPALATSVSESYLSNDPVRSQWISTVGDLSAVHGGMYTFRTKFELIDAVPGSAVLRGRFAADNHVDAIRLNGRSIAVPDHGGDPPFDRLFTFVIREGFVEGTNVLEIDLRNYHSSSGTPMALLVELEGSVLCGERRSAATAKIPPQTDKEKEVGQ